MGERLVVGTGPSACLGMGPLRFERKSTAPQAARIPSYPMAPSARVRCSGFHRPGPSAREGDSAAGVTPGRPSPSGVMAHSRRLAFGIRPLRPGPRSHASGDRSFIKADPGAHANGEGRCQSQSLHQLCGLRWSLPRRHDHPEGAAAHHRPGSLHLLWPLHPDVPSWRPHARPGLRRHADGEGQPRRGGLDAPGDADEPRNPRNHGKRPRGFPPLRGFRGPSLGVGLCLTSPAHRP